MREEFHDVSSPPRRGGWCAVTRPAHGGAGRIDGQRIAVSGETGRIDVWRKGAEPGYSPEAAVELSGYAGEGEFSGIAHNPQTGEYYLSSDETLTIAVADATGRLLRELSFEDDLRGRLKPGRSLSEYELSGLDYVDGRLFAVSETFNTLFIIDPEHGLVRTLGIENGGQISAIGRAGPHRLPAARSQLRRRASAAADGGLDLTGHHAWDRR